MNWAVKTVTYHDLEQTLNILSRDGYTIKWMFRTRNEGFGGWYEVVAYKMSNKEDRQDAEHARDERETNP